MIRRVACALTLTTLLVASGARGQSNPFPTTPPTTIPAPPPLLKRPPRPLPPPPPIPPSSEPVQVGTAPDRRIGEGLMDRFGSRAIDRLLRSPVSEDRLRGIRRAAAVGTEEALGALVDAMEAGELRSDGQTMLTVATELAPRAADPLARKVLGGVVYGVGGARIRREPKRPDQKEAEAAPELVRLARRIATRALAESPIGRGALVDALRGERGGQIELEDLVFTGSTPRLFEGDRPTTVRIVELAALSQDLRALPRLRTLAEDSAQPKLRIAAVRGLAAMRDGKSDAIFAAVAAEKDDELAIAGLDGLLAIHDARAEKVLLERLADEGTRSAAVARSHRLPTPNVLASLKLGLEQASDSQAGEIFLAISRMSVVEATNLLVARLEDPMLAERAAFALGRSKSPLPATLRALAGKGGALGRRIARLLFLRDDEPAQALLAELLRRFATSHDVADRALAALLKGDGSEIPAKEPEALSALASTGARAAWTRDTFLARYRSEKSERVRAMLVASLPDRVLVSLPGSLIEEREQKGGLDREAIALALSATRPIEETLSRITAAEDPALRAALARGLSFHRDPRAAGFLSERYFVESDTVVRRALLGALARRKESSPARTRTLDWARRFEPDALCRQLADGLEPDARSVYWIEARGEEGKGADGVVLLPDGRTRPFVADADGMVLLPGVPFEGSRVILTPRIGERTRDGH